jgi:CRISPR-associated protein Cas1
MSSHRVLLLEGPLYLAIDTGRLSIKPCDGRETFVLPDDIAVLIVDHPAITITSGALKKLAEANCIVLVTDEKHLPLAETIPFGAPTRAGRRLRQQLALEKSPNAARLWRDFVATRVLTQSTVLRRLGRSGALYLERLAKKVEAGDRSNIEAQAAKHYWKHLFPEGFRREKQGADDGVNSRLNYGYAVLRSLIARALVAAGLQPMIGIGHHSEENPFNLADDFMEPYRFVVEQHVSEILSKDSEAPFNASARKDVAACAAREVLLDGQTFRLPAAIDETVESFTRLLEAADPGRIRLAMPRSLA